MSRIIWMAHEETWNLFIFLQAQREIESCETPNTESLFNVYSLVARRPQNSTKKHELKVEKFHLHSYQSPKICCWWKLNGKLKPQSYYGLPRTEHFKRRKLTRIVQKYDCNTTLHNRCTLIWLQYFLNSSKLILELNLFSGQKRKKKLCETW